MPGSGKSTLGRGLALDMGLTFVDLDNEIQLKKGKTIAKIFEDEGENVFRSLESEALKEISNRIDSFVMSTGGGAPCYHQNMKFMNTEGQTIYLSIGLEELVKRLRAEIKTRPLLTGKASLKTKVENLLKTRSDIYKQSKIVIESDLITVANLRNVLVKN